MKVKELGDKVGKNGFTYAIIARTSTRALWEQRDRGRVVAYEAGYRRFRPPRLSFPNETGYDLVESFWSNEDIGPYADTLPPNKDLAVKRFNEIPEEKE